MNKDTDPYIDTIHRELTGYYRFHAHIYDYTRWSFLFGRQKLVEQLPALESQSRILEIGCGTGRNLRGLSERFPDTRIYGMDISAAMLEKAKSLFDQPGHITLINRPYGEELPSYRPFDLILLSYTLTMTGTHLENILERVFDDLKPGGYVAVVDFHKTPFHLFSMWMQTNHVSMDGQVLPLLNEYFLPVSQKITKAYLGLWTYFIFLGRRP